MQEHLTLVGPESPADIRGLSSSLPPDLMEQVRGRVRLLALLLLVAFLFDPLVYFCMWAIATVAGYPVILGQLGFRFIDLGAVAASGALWWVARNRAISADRLHTLGLLRHLDGAADASRTYGTPSAVGPSRAAHTSGTRPAGSRFSGRSPDRPASIGEGTVDALGEINGAGVWTEDQARDWWSKHQPTAV
jgi:hypothetical protein